MSKRDRDNRYRRAYRKRNADAGLCPDDGRPLADGHKRCAVCVERNRANLKRRRDVAAAKGICVVCFTFDAEPGRRCCRQCVQDAKERAAGLVPSREWVD